MLNSIFQRKRFSIFHFEWSDFVLVVERCTTTINQRQRQLMKCTMEFAHDTRVEGSRYVSKQCTEWFLFGIFSLFFSLRSSHSYHAVWFTIRKHTADEWWQRAEFGWQIETSNNIGMNAWCGIAKLTRYETRTHKFIATTLAWPCVVCILAWRKIFYFVSVNILRSNFFFAFLPCGTSQFYAYFAFGSPFSSNKMVARGGGWW